METTLGNITLDLYPGDAPNTVANFVRLAQSGYYDGTRFHRVINDFMIQGGDPLSKDVASKDRWGTGGPDEMFADEINSRKLVRGSLAMANRGPDTNGSQFFIVTKEATPWLDGKHTNFGQVVGGMDVVEKIGQVKVDANDRPLNDVIVKKVTVL
ncbi:MAG: peptidylprolyl isomerase [Patescibacteria group bacterium]|nr:peptidylprolyl isomerase [Patescibacteria group bacterium]